MTTEEIQAFIDKHNLTEEELAFLRMFFNEEIINRLEALELIERFESEWHESAGEFPHEGFHATSLGALVSGVGSDVALFGLPDGSVPTSEIKAELAELEEFLRDNEYQFLVEKANDHWRAEALRFSLSQRRVENG